MNAPTRIGRCPRCGKSVSLATDNLWRPFCSERCKTVDFGDWLDEWNRISDETTDAREEKSEE